MVRLGHWLRSGSSIGARSEGMMTTNFERENNKDKRYNMNYKSSYSINQSDQSINELYMIWMRYSSSLWAENEECRKFNDEMIEMIDCLY